MRFQRFRLFELTITLGILCLISIFSPSRSYAQGNLNVPLISQLPELKNGCEVTSLAMLLQYRGINLDKMTLANQIKKDPTPYRKVGSTIYWGNPNTGFVGDITGSSIGYSAYHGPVFELASRYTNMIDLTGSSFDVILKQLDSGKPVWVISTSTFDTVPSSQWQTIQTSLGPLSMTFHEHSVVLTGYDNNYVYFNDPLANIKNRQVSRAAFVRGWEQFGRQAMTYVSSIGVIDSPVSGLRAHDSINVSGWFLDDSGVSKIEVLVDGQVVGQAAYGDARPDVQNAYPQFTNGNAGYHFALDTTRFSYGNHSITVRETGKNGRVTTLPEKTITFENVKGYLDNPVTGSTLMGTFNVAGWFLDATGVAKIEVLLDGTVVGEASYGDPRSDVQKAYPQYNNGTSGYHFSLDTTKFNEGKHTISIREIGKNGRVTTLPERTITSENVKGYLDNPITDATLKGTYNVAGWFLDATGVAKIEVLLDGTVVGEASYGDPRSDVQKAYPQYNNGTSGYHFSLDTTKFNEGKHTISIREIGKNGRVTTLPERTITSENVKGYLDNPITDETLKGTFNVAGWFLDVTGVAIIEVLVDGTVVGEASYGDPRSDVQKTYPQYNNGTSGYHFSLDTTKFNDGQHTISIRETGKNGRVTTLPEKTITFENVKGYLDNPVTDATLTKIYNVAGWFLDATGVAKIEVLVDGTEVGEASYGDPRSDVQKAYPQYNNGTSGYHFSLDPTKFNDGQHTISIRETGKNGRVTTLPEKTITFENVKGYLDNPVTNATLTGTYNVAGWFLDATGVAKIEVLVDGTEVGEASYGDPRSDVQKAYPQYNNGTSGYHFALDTTKLSDGEHTISIIETGRNNRINLLPKIPIVITNVIGY